MSVMATEPPVQGPVRMPVHNQFNAVLAETEPHRPALFGSRGSVPAMVPDLLVHPEYAD